MADPKKSPSGGAGLGTFAGVFTPSILTILGLILFRRLGYVVGSGGVGHALLLLGMASAISLLTTLSLSAIATNLRVKGGGDYYLISRSLGIEFGGAIGLVLYLAQAISVAFYCVGLAEVVAAFLPEGPFADPRWTAGAAVLFLFAFVWFGADVATKAQFVIMALLGVALVSFFAGGLGTLSGERLAENWSPAREGPGFWVLFAVFFPAVTGFTQGVSLSGDLKEPGRSLPAGTLWAVGISTVVYVGAILVFAGGLDREALVSDYDAMERASAWPALITAGLVAATLSSGLASFLGAPRILQSLAADRVFPPLTPFEKGTGASNNPRRASLLTLAIALGFVAAGGIDLIAPIVSMFFLVSYGLLNYATAFEAKARSPSFRPRFRWFHFRTSLLGAFGCLGAMVMIHPLATAVSLAILFAVYQYVQRLNRPERWVDSRRDHYFQEVRDNLLALARAREHARNWRPRILAFSANPRTRERLLEFASWIEGHAGLTTAVQIIEGSGSKVGARCEEVEKQLDEHIREMKVDAFALAVAAPNLEVGAQTVLQAHGIGPLRANIALLNWYDPGGKGSDAYAKQIRAATRIGANVVVLDSKGAEWQAIRERPRRERRIVVWWQDDSASRLMLLLAYMMTRTEEWSEARIRVVSLARGGETRRRTRLEAILDTVRIDAEADVFDERSPELLVEKGKEADVLFLPLRFRKSTVLDPFGEPVREILPRLPVVAMALAAEDIELDADPDEASPESS